MGGGSRTVKIQEKLWKKGKKMGEEFAESEKLGFAPEVLQNFGG